MATTPSGPPKALEVTGPALILILVIVAALLGYYQIVYYPAAAPKSITFSNVPPTPLNSTVIILPGSGSPPAPSTPLREYYSPSVITVYIGYNATVIWKNNDFTVHTVTTKSPNPPDPRFAAFGPISPQQDWNNIQANASLTFTFDIAGNYSYFCSYHVWMQGLVNVKPAPAGLTASTHTTSKSSSTSSAGFAVIFPTIYFDFLVVAAVLARSLATLIGSGKEPWRVNLSRSFFVLSSLIPTVLTNTL